MKKTMITFVAAATLFAAITPAFAEQSEASKEAEWQAAWDAVGNQTTSEATTESSTTVTTPKASNPEAKAEEKWQDAWDRVGGTTNPSKKSDDNVDATVNPDKPVTQADKQKDAKQQNFNKQVWLKAAAAQLEELKALRAELVQEMKDHKNDAWSTAGSEARIKELDGLISKLSYSVEKETYFQWTGEDLVKLEDVTKGRKVSQSNSNVLDKKQENKSEAGKSEAGKSEAGKKEAKDIKAAKTEKGDKKLPKTSAVK